MAAAIAILRRWEVMVIAMGVRPAAEGEPRAAHRAAEDDPSGGASNGGARSGTSGGGSRSNGGYRLDAEQRANAL